MMSEEDLMGRSVGFVAGRGGGGGVGRVARRERVCRRRGRVLRVGGQQSGPEYRKNSVETGGRGSGEEPDGGNGAPASDTTPKEGSRDDGEDDSEEIGDEGEEYSGKMEIPQEDVLGIRLIFGSETFFATEVLSPPGGLIFRGNLRGEPAVTLSKLEERLSSRFGDKYTICLAEGEEDLKPVVVVVPAARDQRPSSLRQRQISVMAAVLCLMSCLYRVAYGMFGVDLLVSPQSVLSPALAPLVVPLALAILFASFLAIFVQHTVAARWKVNLSPSVILPSNAFGTSGAITNVRSAAPSRDALFDIAFSGAGFLLIVSLLMFVGGLALSTSAAGVLTVPSSTLTESLLLSYITKQVLGAELLRSAARDFVGLHWLAVLGANCATVAALNLLPIRQLDGGRMVAAVFGRKTAVLASRVTVFLLLMSTPNSTYLLFFLAFVLFGPWSVDRPAKNELSEPGVVRSALGLVALAVMMLVLLPKPSTIKLF